MDPMNLAANSIAHVASQSPALLAGGSIMVQYYIMRPVTVPLRWGWSRASTPPVGMVLMQMVGERQLKVEVFPGSTAAQVAGFDSNALIYER